MIRLAFLGLIGTLAGHAAVAGAMPEGFPFSNESLDYVVKFPSGIPFGEAHFQAALDAARGWTLKMNLSAPLPNFLIQDSFSAFDTLGLCTIRADRQSSHGRKKSQEYTIIDSARAVAIRATANGGGVTEIPVSACPHDGLSFLYLIRRELGQGRVPANGKILVGSAYDISIQYVGEKTLNHKSKDVLTDQVNCIVTGPASTTKLEILFARDAARTPLVIRTPFVLGTFSMELAR